MAKSIGGDKGELRVGRDKDQGESQDVTLERTGIEDGIVLPMLMGWHWSTLDPTDLTRVRYMEEVAAELGTPIDGEEVSKQHPKRY